MGRLVGVEGGGPSENWVCRARLVVGPLCITGLGVCAVVGELCTGSLGESEGRTPPFDAILLERRGVGGAAAMRCGGWQGS